jgi:hypothetical protein
MEHDIITPILTIFRSPENLFRDWPIAFDCGERGACFGCLLFLLPNLQNLSLSGTYRYADMFHDLVRLSQVEEYMLRNLESIASVQQSDPTGLQNDRRSLSALMQLPSLRTVRFRSLYVSSTQEPISPQEPSLLGQLEITNCRTPVGDMSTLLPSKMPILTAFRCHFASGPTLSG